MLGERVEQPSPLAQAAARKTRLPGDEDGLECVAKLLQLAQPNVQRLQLCTCQCVDSSARGAPSSAFDENFGELAERKSKAKRGLDDSHLLLGGRRKPTRPTSRARCEREKPETLVVPKRVGAQSGASGKYPNRQSRK